MGIVYFSSLSDSLREFSEEELNVATNCYSELVGKGSFGSVYKGAIQQ